MELPTEQEELFDKEKPADQWEMQATKRALDELFVLVCQYKSSESYSQLIQFITRFHFYSPYNAMLIHIQMPGAEFVAPAHRWRDKYGRTVKPDARPIVILQPMGPVMFVFDVANTEPGNHAKPLPLEVVNPFEVRSGSIRYEWEKTIENAKRDGIRILIPQQGSQSAGRISKTQNQTQSQMFQTGKDKNGDPIFEQIPVRYELLINSNMKKPAQYATLVHELAHLYCGHIGTPNNKWWPDRLGLNELSAEFEAESVTYLVCERLGIDNPSDKYLSSYLKKNQDIPNISIECVMKVAGLIEQMGREHLKLRKKV